VCYICVSLPATTNHFLRFFPSHPGTRSKRIAINDRASVKLRMRVRRARAFRCRRWSFGKMLATEFVKPSSRYRRRKGAVQNETEQRFADDSAKYPNGGETFRIQAQLRLTEQERARRYALKGARENAYAKYEATEMKQRYE
jgi:hypothetical protein